MKRLREPVDASLLVNDDDIDFVDGVYVVRKKQNNNNNSKQEWKEKRAREKDAGRGARGGEGIGSSPSNNAAAETVAATATLQSSLQRDITLYTPKVNMKNAAVCRWTDEPHANLLEIIKMRGNFWRNNGFSYNSHNYLYVEEAVLLAEKGSVIVLKDAAAVEMASTYRGVSSADDTTPDDGMRNLGDSSEAVIKPSSSRSRDIITIDRLDPSCCVPLSELFTRALLSVPMPVYLTFSKLKSLEYMVMRHNRAISPLGGARSSSNPLRAVSCAREVRRIARSLEPGEKLLDAIASFDIYISTQNWSKKNAMSAHPVGHVVVTTSTKTLPSDLMLRLLDEAAGVPVLFAAVMASGYVMLEEFADAIIALDWTNDFADDNDTAMLFSSGAEGAGVATALDNSRTDDVGDETADINDGDNEDVDNDNDDDDEIL